MEESQPVEKNRTSSPPRGGSQKIVRRSFEERLRVVKLHLEEGFTQEMVAREAGLSNAAVAKWVARYRREGEEGLRDRDHPGSRTHLPEPVQNKILELKKAEPSRGIKRISQLLRRVFLLRASPKTVGQILRREGLVKSPPKPRRNLVRPRFFERARPNQMWQTDIFTFRLGGRYAYVIAFMDDYSRFLVGADLFRSHTAENVLEVFRVASGEYQPPKEMLTDNGREFVNWRGTTRFQAEMKKNGIHHFKSRPHHPMTLGKIERFWETIWQEFLSRAQFESFESARERIRLWIKYYNHKRPHQGIEGLCPADRYFEIATELRKTIETGIQDNLLEMALRGQPKAPFYMVGRMEGQSVILRAEKGKLKLSVENGTENKELVYDLKQPVSQNPAAPTQLLGPGESPGGVVGVDGAVQAGGDLPPTQHQLGDFHPMAKAGHGGDAPSPGAPGQSEAGPGSESAAAGPLAAAPALQQPQTPAAPGADCACQTGGVGAKTSVDDSLPIASQSDSAGARGPVDGPGGGAATGHLPPGVLQVGEARTAGAAASAGRSAPGAAGEPIGPGEGTTPKPGETTRTPGATV
jgi:transposase InsO family protein